jgi:flagellar biosynthetic protein FlhB
LPDEEKTEQPTARRRSKAREEGQVAKGRELSGVVVLMTGLLMFYFAGRDILDRIRTFWGQAFMNIAHEDLTTDGSMLIMVSCVETIARIVLPIMIAVFFGAVVANVVQVGFNVSWKSITPDLKKLDPIQGVKKFFSLKSLVELVKNILKLVIVGTVVYYSIKAEVDGAFILMDQDAWGVLLFVLRVAFDIVMRTAWVLLILAILDYVYQKYEHEKSLKMTKQEVKDEYKQSEGDPQIKSRIRTLQREMARKRMMEAIPQADVVITNPTHLAVALKYEKGMTAPVVLAKGAGFIALKIREIASKHRVAIVENPGVAQLLYKTTDIGQEIPAKLYRAVAEILAHVFRLRKKSVT